MLRDIPCCNIFCRKFVFVVVFMDIYFVIVVSMLGGLRVSAQPILEKDGLKYGQCFDVEQFFIRSMTKQRTINDKIEQSISSTNKKLDRSVSQLRRQVRNLKRMVSNMLRDFTQTTTVQPIKITPPGKVPGTGSEQVSGVQEPSPGSSNTKIAFYAAVSIDTETNPIVFDQVRLNDGGCYNNTNGIFTSDVTGVFLFTWTVEVFGEVDVGASLEVNGVSHGQTWSDADVDHYDSSTGVAVLRISSGDKVWVKIERGSTIDARQSTFSGVYLYN